MPRLLISAAHKSSGKTTVTVGLCAALTTMGKVVQPFKKGPDYIDPMWLRLASGRSCFNLDSYLMGPEQLAQCFSMHSGGADVRIVEGNKGLYDGLALDGSNSNAALAHLLDLPVVLVLDARGMTRGIAPLILGYQAFDARIRIAGVILNQLGGSRHESKLRAVIEHYTDVSVVGAIGHDPRLAVVERHLGLMPSHEQDDAMSRVEVMGQAIAEHVDVERVFAIASSVVHRPQNEENSTPSESVKCVRIGVARDKAFGFYYPDDLLALEQAGAELVMVDTLQDRTLPALDGLFIGGGFPEMFMPQLQANSSMRNSIRNAIEADMPVYAECGGLMYLARTLQWKGQAFKMVGALQTDVVMHDRPIGRGYVQLEATGNAPWLPVASDGAASLRGHEFHYSCLENTDTDLKFAYRVARGHGVDGVNDGLVYRNVVASYTHLRDNAGSRWATQFVKFVRAHRDALGASLPEFTKTLWIQGTPVLTDSEGYLRTTDDWSPAFAIAQASAEDLVLTPAHWEVLEFLRSHYEAHRVQAQVRTMIKYFSRVWGPDRGNNHHLHDLFPIGGPQKQGNRLAGLMKTKGEH